MRQATLSRRKTGSMAGYCSYNPPIVIEKQLNADAELQTSPINGTKTIN